MALQPTFCTAPPSPYSWLVPITEISALGSTIIDGLGVFGLAASGIFPALLQETSPLQSVSKPSVGNVPKQ